MSRPRSHDQPDRRARARFLLAFGVTALLLSVPAAVAVKRVSDRGPEAPTASPTDFAEGSNPDDGSAQRLAERRAALREARRQAAEASAYAFPVAGCDVSYAAVHHDYPATDIFADAECSFVAPTSGVVDEVGRRDAWDPAVNDGATRGGLFVSLLGDDGVRYYGSHLSSVEVVVDQHVDAGERLGGLGQTGSARGTGNHLHFGISWPTPAGSWWIRRGAVPPSEYLDAWRAGRPRSPRAEVLAAQRDHGRDDTCRSYC